MTLGPVVWIVAGAVALVAVGYALHRFLRYAASRNWIYYGEHRRPPGQGFNLIGQIYSPEMSHVVEETASKHVERSDEESGDRPADEFE